MSVKIPQNIDKEDKLVGPLTLKQFLYLLGGAAVVFLVYQYYVIGYLFLTEFVIISLIAMVFAIMLAFVQINGRPFNAFLANLGAFIVSPKRQFWHKSDQLESRPVKISRPKVSPAASSKMVSKSQLEQLATILDTGGKMETAELAATHEINNLTEPSTQPRFSERELGVEDVLSDTDS